MIYWYSKDNQSQYTFCYSLDKKEQEIVDKLLPQALMIFMGEKQAERTEKE